MSILRPLTSLSNLVPLVFTLALEGFNDFVEKNREHQNYAYSIAAQPQNIIGQIISPCGTGKTRIQTMLHVFDMIEKTKNNDIGIYVIASHRLALNRQLRDEVVDLIIRCGIPCDILCVSSDRGDDIDDYYRKYAYTGYSPKESRHTTTTNIEKIKSFVDKARDLKRHVLVVSTYNSFDRIADIGKIDLATFDEAQNIVREDFASRIQKVKPNIARQYFFTATRRVKDNDGGMDDKEFYGPVLVDIKPQLMLERGEIACPRIHVVHGSNYETTGPNSKGMITKSIIEGFSTHRDQIKKDSINPSGIGAKVIVGLNGISEAEDVYFDPKYIEFTGGNNIQRFIVSSNRCFVNDTETSPEVFFSKMNELEDNQDAIIFHIDMLGEGVDLPSITGVMPMRNLGIIKLIQLIGRALRLHERDRQRLYSGQLQPADYNNKEEIDLGYEKPYGYLILHEHLNTLSDHDEMKEIILRVYKEYLSPFERLVIVDKYKAQDPIDLKSIITKEKSDGKQFDLEHSIMDIVLAAAKQNLDDEIKNMTPQEAINHILQRAKK